MDESTGVGVLDKIDLILATIATEPSTLAELSEATGIARPTAHRLAGALIMLRYLERDAHGRYVLGSRLNELAGSHADELLVRASAPVLHELRDTTAASAQLYQRRGAERLCVAAVEPVAGLRDSVPVGTSLPMTAGSAAQVLAAWDSAEQVHALCATARYTAADLARVRRLGWAHSVGEREAGLASVSAPIRDPHGGVIAAVSVSGPIERIGKRVRPPITAAVLRAADQLQNLVNSGSPESY